MADDESAPGAGPVIDTYTSDAGFKWELHDGEFQGGSLVTITQPDGTVHQCPGPHWDTAQAAWQQNYQTYEPMPQAVQDFITNAKALSDKLTEAATKSAQVVATIESVNGFVEILADLLTVAGFLIPACGSIASTMKTVSAKTDAEAQKVVDADLSALQTSFDINELANQAKLDWQIPTNATQVLGDAENMLTKVSDIVKAALN
jgi:hypothetical protein